MDEEEYNDGQDQEEYEHPGAQKFKKVYEAVAPELAAGVALLPVPGARIAAGAIELGALISGSIQAKKKNTKPNPSGRRDGLGRERMHHKHHHKYKFQHE